MSRDAPERPDLRLLAPAAVVWLTALAALRLPPALVLSAAGVAAATGVALLTRRRRAAILVAALCLCAAAGTSTSLRVHARGSGPLHDAAVARAAVVVDGVLLDDPRVTVPRSSGALAVRELVVARLRVERLQVAGRRYTLRSPVLVLATDRAWLPLLPSQHLRAEGRLQAPGPGDDVAALLSARGELHLLGSPSPLQRAAGTLREGLRRAVAPLPEAERGLLPGLVVGDVSRLDPGLQRDFRTTGLTHLTAVSGTNVAVLLGAVLLLCGRLRIPLRVRPVPAGLALVAFAVLARPSPSVLRASVMGALALLALGTGSRRSALPALSAAVIVLVLVSPDMAVSAGFALSVLATAGLLVLAPGWRERLARHLPAWLADAIAVPAAAQVVCGPVVVALSAQLGLLSVPANLLAVPAVAPATVLGVAAALVAPVCLPLGQGLSWLAWLPTAWLVRVARTGAQLPGAAVPWRGDASGAFLLVALTVVLAVVLHARLPRRVLGSACAGMLVTAGSLTVLAPGWPPPGWFLVTCDVGQGDALVLAAGPHTAVVVDTGPDPAPIDACLSRLGVRRVPLVVLTHLHADHVEGLPGVLRGRPVGGIELGPLDEPAIERRRVLGWAAGRHVPVSKAVVGEVRRAGGARWQVLAPERAFHGTTSDPNNSSLVLRLQAPGGPVVLLTGDVEKDAQRSLLASGADLRAVVLKVPHHGSDHQDPDFLRAVGARVVMTSVGTGNPYGHPSPRTLGQLVDQGARSYRTDHDGDVALVSRGPRLSSVARAGAGTVATRPRVTGLPGTGLTVRADTLPDLPGLRCSPSDPPLPAARGPPGLRRCAGVHAERPGRPHPRRRRRGAARQPGRPGGGAGWLRRRR